MQEKMATRNPVARAIASVTSRLWFPAALSTSRNLPRPLMHRGGRALAAVYYRLRPKYLRAARRNLAVILGEPEDSPRVRALAFEMVASHFRAWVDFLHFATRPPEEAARLVEGVVGYSRIVQARLAGKGVLLLTAHLGNWEVGGLMLARVNQPIHVVLVPDIFPGVERERRRLHERLGVAEIRVDRSFVPTLSVLRVLGENGIVAMQGDRDFDNTGIAIPFFGREAYFPRGPLRVAMASGAVVLPAFIVGLPDGRYRAIVEEPLAVVSEGDRDAALRTNLAAYVALLERYVRAFPEQWYCFYPFWDDPSRKGRRALTAATKNAS
ncbi:MAG TPA: lysophospholipid acyltransferase family protein [Thermoanaerobaculia bacterium]|nr:lysophospholipid acyltransferase family protein [Thermoanaerobaculia bacterium]